MAVNLNSGEHYDNLFGIFIGIETFPNSAGEIKSLFHANEDAYEMYKFFFKKSREKQRKDKLCLLVDEQFRKDSEEKFKRDLDSYKVIDATRINILRKLTEYLKLAKADDLLLLYISTHGIIDFDDYFFIPSDGDIENILGTGISSTTLIQALGKASSKGIKVLMIIDTCHAGAVGFDLSKYQGNFSCLLSCSPIEYSYEYFDIQHGIFTNSLIEALNGKASKDQKSISLGELYNYIYKKVQNESKKQQNPLLIGTMPYETVLIAN